MEIDNPLQETIDKFTSVDNKRDLFLQWYRTPKRKRGPLADFADKIDVDSRTVDKWVAQVKASDNYKSERKFTTDQQIVDEALINSCRRGNAGSLKLYYQLTGKLVEKTDNTHKVVPLTADDYARFEREAKEELRKELQRIHQVPDESRILLNEVCDDIQPDNKKDS